MRFASLDAVRGGGSQYGVTEERYFVIALTAWLGDHQPLLHRAPRWRHPMRAERDLYFSLIDSARDSSGAASK